MANLEKQMQAVRLVYAGGPLRHMTNCGMTLVSHMAMHWDSYRGNLGD